MTGFANSHDIARFVKLTDDGSTPNLRKLAGILDRLAAWTDNNSDGWAFWSKPSRAAGAIIARLEDFETAWLTGGFVTDVDDRARAAATTPVKRFLTRHGVDDDTRALILEGTPPARVIPGVDLQEGDVFELAAGEARYVVRTARLLRFDALVTVFELGKGEKTLTLYAGTTVRLLDRPPPADRRPDHPRARAGRPPRGGLRHLRGDLHPRGRNRPRARPPQRWRILRRPRHHHRILALHPQGSMTMSTPNTTTVTALELDRHSVIVRGDGTLYAVKGKGWNSIHGPSRIVSLDVRDVATGSARVLTYVDDDSVVVLAHPLHRLPEESTPEAARVGAQGASPMARST